MYVEAITASHFRAEVANALVTLHRRKGTSEEELVLLGEDLGRLRIKPVGVYPPIAMEEALRHGLSVYEATYLALAKRMDIGLATLDRALREAAVRMELRFCEDRIYFGIGTPWLSSSRRNSMRDDMAES